MNNGDSAPLVVHEISKSYGARSALRGVSFCVQRASCVGLLGPNGAGKTTAIKICMGASRADAGRVSVLGLPLPNNALAARAQVGVVPQSNILDPDFNCTENLAVYARYFGIDQKPPINESRHCWNLPA
ncbi:MAG: ATP-binding cassette domain-containing protein [Candidatus Zeuxoniibacter abyssi]|nr:MAG: ATP-binding cassette domain-containing protein [Candidatus Persebacteraceae bacterium AB1(2)]